MKFLKYIFFAFIGMILLLVLATFFLESSFDIKRSIDIKAPVSKVFEDV